MTKAGRDYAIPGETDRTKAMSTSRLRNKTAQLLQKAIRMEAADDHGQVVCVTCGKVDAWNSGFSMQCGHFVAGRSTGVLFDERNLHVQCNRCNVYLHGNQEAYAAFMLSKYGQAVIDELRALRKQTVKLYRSDLLAMRQQYLDRIKEQERRLQ